MRAWVEHVDGFAEGVLGRDYANIIGMVEKSLWAAGDALAWVELDKALPHHLHVGG